MSGFQTRPGELQHALSFLAPTPPPPPRQAFPRSSAPARHRTAQPVWSKPLLPGLDPDCSFALSMPAQVLQRLLGRKLLRFLFCSAFGTSHVFRLALSLNIDARLHRKG